jgi:hemerythrin-like domain-containing protein
MDLLTHLADEHRELLGLMAQLQAAADAGDTSALANRLMAAHAALTNGLDAHIALEEERVFSGIGSVLGDDLVAPFRDEHQEIRALRDEVLALASRGNAPPDLCLRLCDLVVEHQQREDLVLFPCARDALDSRDLEVGK